MSIFVVKLLDLLESIGESETKKILKTFESLPDHDNGEVNEVESFLHNKAIHFDKNSISTTHLVFSRYQDELVLVGFYALASKPLIISKKNFNNLSSGQKKRFKQHGNPTESGGYQIYSYLIGQLGKNYSDEAKQTKAISGEELLTLAYDAVVEVSKIITAKYVWIECANRERLIAFYNKFGFSKIEGYESVKDNVVMVMKIKQ